MCSMGKEQATHGGDSKCQGSDARTCLVGRSREASVAGVDGGWGEEKEMESEVRSGWCGADTKDLEAIVRVWVLYK